MRSRTSAGRSVCGRAPSAPGPSSSGRASCSTLPSSATIELLTETDGAIRFDEAITEVTRKWDGSDPIRSFEELRYQEGSAKLRHQPRSPLPDIHDVIGFTPQGRAAITATGHLSLPR